MGEDDQSAKEKEYMDVQCHADFVEDDLILPLGAYESYYQSILSDHVAAVEELLSTSEPSDRKRLLNGHFDFPDLDLGCQVEGHLQVLVCRPLGVAAAAGSLGVVKVLLENFVDVTKTERDGNNVIHTLIMTSAAHPEMESRMLEVYDFLCKNIPRDDLRWMLRMENHEDQTPLELSVVLSCYSLTEAIFNTRGVHLSKVITTGVTSWLWYDITEYENFNADFGKRKTMSPLTRFLSLPKNKLEDPAVHRLVKKDNGLFGLWLQAKEKCYIIPMVLIFLTRVVLVAVFTLYCMDMKWAELQGGRPEPIRMKHERGIDDTAEIVIGDHQATVKVPITDAEKDVFYFCQDYMTNVPDNFIIGFKYFVIVYTFLWYAKEAWTIYLCTRQERDHNVGKAFKTSFGFVMDSKKKCVLQWEAYFAAHYFLPILMVMVVYFLPICTERESAFTVFVDILRILCLVDVTLYLVFFLQLSPFFGPFIITMTRMINELLRFGIVLVVALQLFSSYFVVFVNAKSNQGCIHEYSSVFRTMYTIFTMTLNMSTLTHFDLATPGVLYLLHVLCSLLIGIMLFNFLIGILSNSVSEMAANMTAIKLVQHLSVVSLVEFQSWTVVRFYYRWIQARYFTCKDGRVYIIRRLHSQEAKKEIR